MSHFITRTRGTDTDNNKVDFVTYAEHCPQYIRDAVRAAHDAFGVLPNDFIFATCEQADCWSDCDEDESDCDTLAAATAETMLSRYVYDTDAFAWAAANVPIISEVGEEGRDQSASSNPADIVRACVWVAAYRAALAFLESVEESKADFINTATEGYVESLLWTSSLEGHDVGEDVREEAREYVGDFIGANWRAIVESDQTPYRVGVDFWLARNGHGAGFDLDDDLRKAAKVYGGLDPYVGDDGTVHVA